VPMIQPAVMAPPLNRLVSNAAGNVTGRRFLAVHWDQSLPPEEAVEGEPLMLEAHHRRRDRDAALALDRHPI
jgi:hypothetical protein